MAQRPGACAVPVIPWIRASAWTFDLFDRSGPVRDRVAVEGLMAIFAAMVLRLVAAGTLGVALLAPDVASACSMVPPSAAIQIGMTPASPRAGSEVRLTGGAGAESYAWDLDGDGQFDDAVGKVVTASFPAGQRTVAARASTPLGVLTDTRTFTVHAWNATPTGTIRATPPNARAGVPVRVSAEGSDPDGPAVQTALDLDGDGTFETAGATGTATFATPGQRVIRARFTDDAGAWSVATTTLDVRAGNLPPTVSILAPISGGMCGDGKLRVAAADPDGELVRYEYDRDGDGTFETDRGGDASKPDHSFVGVRVTDDSGAAATARGSGLGMDVWTFPDTFPSVAQVGAPIKLSVWTSSAVAWDADGDGDFDDGTGKEITFTYPSTGTYEVRVREREPPVVRLHEDDLGARGGRHRRADGELERGRARPSGRGLLGRLRRRRAARRRRSLGPGRGRQVRRCRAGRQREACVRRTGDDRTAGRRCVRAHRRDHHPGALRRRQLRSGRGACLL